MMHSLKNGAVWRDTNGNILHAHGGHMLLWEGYYYWYGENRTGDNYVSVYRSQNLTDWEFRRNILTTESKIVPSRLRVPRFLKNEDGTKVNIERPKVLYNALTQKFVLWAHFENGHDYLDAAACVATCDTPDGDFVYHGQFRPFGNMSRDCSLFQETDGTAYFMSAGRDNRDMFVYRLQEDYLNVARQVNTLWSDEYREAPAVMKKDGRYFFFSSGCSGWDPNQCRYAIGGSLDSDFTMLRDIADAVTYRTQPAFILPVTVDGRTTYLYCSDRWCEQDYHDSRYVFLPIRFDENGLPVLEYTDTFVSPICS